VVTSRALPWLVTAAALALPPAGSAAQNESIPGVDTSALPASARPELDRVLEDEFCGCGSPHTLKVCLRSHPECRHSKRLARIALLEAARGVTAAEIGVELGRYEQSFRDPRRSLTPDDRQCSAKAAPSVPRAKGTPEDPPPADRPGPVTLVEFSDFECPHCALARPVLEKFAADSNGKVRLCWMAFPLTQHPNSLPAAQAALFARDRGKFWAVHDALFENQTRLSTEVIQELVQKSGLPGAEWKKALAAGTYKEQVETQRAAGVSAGVEATPTLYVNGRKLELLPSPEVLTITVEDELDWQRTHGTWTAAVR
jgi:protein-disulfide isomerase